MRYKIKVYDPAYVQLLEFNDYRNITIEHAKNSVSTCTIQMPYDNRNRFFGLDHIIEVYRRADAFCDWSLEFIGFHRTGQIEISDEDNQIFTSYSRGLLDLIRRRVICYYSNSPFTLKRGPAEHVIKDFVIENAGRSAVSPPRLVNGVTPYLSIDVVTGVGKEWIGMDAYKNLLESIADIANASGVVFEVVKNGTPSFLFTCDCPRDVSAVVSFAIGRGNMDVPLYVNSRTEEITRAIVLGQESDNRRRIVVRESINKQDSPWNIIEDTTDAHNIIQNPMNTNQEIGYLAYVNSGDVKLKECEARESMSFTPIQVRSCLYGVDYILNDLVTGILYDKVLKLQIIGVNVNVSAYEEKISLEFEKYEPVS